MCHKARYVTLLAHGCVSQFRGSLNILLRSFYYLDIAPPEKQHPLFTWLVFMVANPILKHCLVADSEAASSDQLVWSKDLL